MVSDFRLFLQNLLIERKSKNPNYSLRALASSLGMDPSTLSQVIRKKRPLSTEKIISIGEKLELSPKEIKNFIFQSTRHATAKDQNKKDFQILSEDTFHVISDWYHFAILELMRTKNFKQNLKWIAKELGISIHEARAAVDRLIRLKMILTDELDRWKIGCLRSSIATYTNNNTSAARKKYQKQILQKGLEAIDQYPLGVRDNSAMTLAISSKKLPLAIEEIQRFRRDFCEKIDSSEPYDQVYHLTVAFYPVTQSAKENKNFDQIKYEKKETTQ